MLRIKKEILQQLRQSFSLSHVETGFILGTYSCLEQLEYCYQIPAVQAGIHYYSPDIVIANKKIKEWTEVGICFCGFIHSHVVKKVDFSNGDIEFAKKLMNSYRLPVLWFGLGVVNDDCEVDIYFYSVTQQNNFEIDIKPISIITI